jgi:hypothetical protein
VAVAAEAVAGGAAEPRGADVRPTRNANSGGAGGPPGGPLGLAIA